MTLPRGGDGCARRGGFKKGTFLPEGSSGVARTIAIWVFGLLASAIFGGLVADRFLSSGYSSEAGVWGFLGRDVCVHLCSPMGGRATSAKKFRTEACAEISDQGTPMKILLIAATAFGMLAAAPHYAANAEIICTPHLGCRETGRRIFRNGGRITHGMTIINHRSGEKDSGKLIRIRRVY